MTHSRSRIRWILARRVGELARSLGARNERKAEREGSESRNPRRRLHLARFAIPRKEESRRKARAFPALALSLGIIRRLEIRSHRCALKFIAGGREGGDSPGRSREYGNNRRKTRGIAERRGIPQRVKL